MNYWKENSLKCTNTQAIQNVDEFVSSSEQREI